MGTSLALIAGAPAVHEDPLHDLDHRLGGRVAVPTIQRRLRASTGYGICTTCHGPSAAGTSRCWSCLHVLRQLHCRPPAVTPTFLFVLGSPVHQYLVGYKAAATAQSRAVQRRALAEWLGLFLDRHLGCLLSPSGDPAILVPVPSSIGGRLSWGGIHPLVPLCQEALTSCSPEVGRRLSVRQLLVAGDQPPARLRANAYGYRPAGEPVRGESVILVDDVFTSGARMLSAAAAVSGAGGQVAGALPLGRLVRPGHNAATARYWADHGARPAGADSCAACPTSVGTPERRRELAFADRRVVERLAA